MNFTAISAILDIDHSRSSSLSVLKWNIQNVTGHITENMNSGMCRAQSAHMLNMNEMVLKIIAAATHTTNVSSRLNAILITIDEKYRAISRLPLLRPLRITTKIANSRHARYPEVDRNLMRSVTASGMVAKNDA